VAVASWPFHADWSISWTTGPPSPWPHESLQPSFTLSGTESSAAPASCVAYWVVSFLLPAADRAVDELDCVTSPSSPLLLMRTGALVLLAQHCVESADESADCLLPAFWSMSCTT
jgi:hypothetical protein